MWSAYRGRERSGRDRTSHGTAKDTGMPPRRTIYRASDNDQYLQMESQAMTVDEMDMTIIELTPLLVITVLSAAMAASCL